jgi:MOSC domain-containing protein YiiM
MQRCDSIELVPGVGVIGDRYALKLGYWSDPRWPDQEVTLIAAETAAAIGVEPRQLRRNIVTEGIELAALIGRRFRAGAAELEGIRACDPCAYLDTLTRPGVARALTGHGGLRARVLQAGRVALGDLVHLDRPSKLTQEA